MPPQHTPRLHALILRVYVDDTGTLRGQVDDPINELRTPFVGIEELIALVVALIGNR